MEAATLTALLADISKLVTSIFSWVGTVSTTIVENPLLLLTTGFMVIGGAVGIFSRLLSRR